MTFLAAGWFWLFVPWFALAAWLWCRNPAERDVSARFLWNDSNSAPASSRQQRIPPAWVLAALLSLAAIILALTDIQIGVGRVKVHLLVDQHVSMAASMDGVTVAKHLREQMDAQLARIDTPVLIEIEALNAGDAADAIEGAFTARSTRQLLEAMTRTFGPGEVVVVLSAQQLSLPDSAIPLSPTTRSTNLGITQFSAIESPTQQAMVAVSHAMDQGSFEVRTQRGSESVSRRVSPTAGQTSTRLFVDLPIGEAPVFSAHIEGQDALSIDNDAFLVLRGGWPRLELEGALNPAVERFAAVYAKQRVPRNEDGRAASRSRLTLSDIDRKVSGIVFSPASEEIEPRELTLQRLTSSRSESVPPFTIRRIAPLPPGFDVVARAGEYPVVAMRETPRTLWVGFDLDAFARTPGWVIWMNDAIDWLMMQGPPRWEGVTSDQIKPDWSRRDVGQGIEKVSAAPGVYLDRNGESHGVNLPAFEWAVETSDPQAALTAAVRTAVNDGAHRLRVPFIAAAALCLLAATALYWRAGTPARR